MTDYKNYHPRNPTQRFLMLAGIFIICAMGWVGNEDYWTQKAIEQEYVQLADKKQAMEHPARIYSRKCERQNKRIYATQADGGNWKIRCVDATVRTIKA